MRGWTVVRSGWVRGALACLLTVAGLACAHAQAAYTPEQFSIASALMRLSALGSDGISAEEIPFARKELHTLGYGSAAVQTVAADMQWSPVLIYDPNMNGGYSTSSFDMGGFVFSVDPRYRAQAGVMAGIRGQGYATFALGGPVAADLSADIRYLHATAAEYSKANVFFGACLRQGLTARTTLRQCATIAASQNDLGFSTVQGAEAGLSHGFGLGNMLLEAGGFARRERLAGGSYQWQGGGTLAMALAAGVRVDMGLALGEPAQHEIAMRQRASAGAMAQIGGAWTRAELTLERRTGGTFLGAPRQENVLSARLLRDITLPYGPSLKGTAILSWDRIRATHAVLENDSLTLEFTFRLR